MFNMNESMIYSGFYILCPNCQILFHILFKICCQSWHESFWGVI